MSQGAAYLSAAAEFMRGKMAQKANLQQQRREAFESMGGAMEKMAAAHKERKLRKDLQDVILNVDMKTGKAKGSWQPGSPEAAAFFQEIQDKASQRAVRDMQLSQVEWEQKFKERELAARAAKDKADIEESENRVGLDSERLLEEKRKNKAAEDAATAERKNKAVLDILKGAKDVLGAYYAPYRDTLAHQRALQLARVRAETAVGGRPKKDTPKQAALVKALFEVFKAEMNAIENSTEVDPEKIRAAWEAAETRLQEGLREVYGGEVSVEPPDDIDEVNAGLNE